MPEQHNPTIGIDCRFGATNTGLGTFTRGLSHALLRRSDPWQYKLFVASLQESWLQALPQGRATFAEAPFPHYSFQEQVALPNLLQETKCDLFYSPHFTIPFFCPVPFVCTVHDLILHRFPNEAPFLKRLAYRIVFSLAVRRARGIVVISKATQDELTSFYGAHIRARSILVYPGIEPIFHPPSEEAKDSVRRKYALIAPYLLYVGNCKQHKNVPGLLHAFKEAGLTGIELVLVTGGPESGSMRRVPGTRFLSEVPRLDLPSLYGAALGTVTPTRAEGFCLPLVEAMASGCPVLATSIGPIPEVTGGHALLVESSVEKLAEGMRKMVMDKTLRSPKQLKDAEEWVKKFSWEKAAEVVSNLFREQMELK